MAAALVYKPCSYVEVEVMEWMEHVPVCQRLNREIRKEEVYPCGTSDRRHCPDFDGCPAVALLGDGYCRKCLVRGKGSTGDGILRYRRH